MTRSTTLRGPGWQATPASPSPGRPPAGANGLLLVIAPAGLVLPAVHRGLAAGQAVILLQRRWHWWRFTSPASSPSAWCWP